MTNVCRNCYGIFYFIWRSRETSQSKPPFSSLEKWVQLAKHENTAEEGREMYKDGKQEGPERERGQGRGRRGWNRGWTAEDVGAAVGGEAGNWQSPTSPAVSPTPHFILAPLPHWAGGRKEDGSRHPLSPAHTAALEKTGIWLVISGEGWGREGFWVGQLLDQAWVSSWHAWWGGTRTGVILSEEGLLPQSENFFFGRVS